MDERESRCRNNRGEIPFAKGSIRSRNSRFEYLIQKKKKENREAEKIHRRLFPHTPYCPPRLIYSTLANRNFGSNRANKSRILKLELYFHGE